VDQGSGRYLHAKTNRIWTGKRRYTMAKKKNSSSTSSSRSGDSKDPSKSPSKKPGKVRRKPGVDEAIPEADSPPLTIVAIGASAGGLAALKRFFSQVDVQSGLAYVVVMHLSPEHKSHLAELLQPHVKMPVQQVTRTTALEPNRVYVIPPGANLNTIDTHLRLTKLEQNRRERAPIDHFYRTLAKTHDGSSVAVILTGSGSDGTLGVRDVKAAGGFAIAQDPNDAEFGDMPQSAISTGLIDVVLPIEKIPAAILKLAHTEPNLPDLKEGEEPHSEIQQLLQKIFMQLKSRTGRDFARYKRSTIMRRIQRRMQLNQIEELDDYLEYLRKEHSEVRTLADDLLITVTNFFRDPEVHKRLKENIIPQLFKGKDADDDIRIWSVGCATGEEAYSLAILLLEEAAQHETVPRLQVFASDLHERSLARARDGVYPADIATDVSPERLKRFFTKENGHYRMRKEVREMVVFAPHNLLSDPPFSRIDLICCRNLLIYLQRGAQRDVIDLFHYALRGEGHLVLGTAESLDAGDLFRLEDKKTCIYRKRNVPAPEPRLPVFPFLHSRAGSEAEVPQSPENIGSYRQIHERLLQQHGPPSALVNSDDKIVHLSELAGRFFLHPGGEPTTNVYKLIRAELRLELRSTLQEARNLGTSVSSKPIPVRLNGDPTAVLLRVYPARGQKDLGFVLIIFEERELNALSSVESPSAAPAETESPADSGREHALESELDLTRQRLQAIVEEYETSQEEMKASNEEMQSTNEELRSTMEELETSKEELQSMNEELQTVNQENRHRVDELSQLSSDLNNLFAATDIATLFLDRELRILRLTPSIHELFNVQITDRGRSLSDFTNRFGSEDLINDARRVIDKLIPIERELQNDKRLWFLTRLLPYRSEEDRIEGVVITFVNITDHKRTEYRLRESEAWQAFLVQFNDTLRPLSAPEEIQQKAAQLLGEHLEVNRAGYVEIDGNEAVVQRGYLKDVLPLPDRFEFTAFQEKLLEIGQSGTVSVDDVAKDSRFTPQERHGLADVEVGAFVVVTLLKNGAIVAALGVHNKLPRTWSKGEVELIRNLAERTWDTVRRARAEEALRYSERRLQAIIEQVPLCIGVLNLEGKMILANQKMQALLPNMMPSIDPALRSRWRHSDDQGKETPPENWPGARALRGISTVPGMEFQFDQLDGGVRWELVSAVPFLDQNDEITGAVVAVLDITERKQAERERDRERGRLETIIEILPAALAFADVSGKIVRHNKAFRELWGLEEDDYSSQNHDDFVAWRHDNGERIEQDQLAIRRALERGKIVRDELIVNQKPGTDEKRYLLNNVSPIWDARGQIVGAVAAMLDVTGRTKAEEALRDLNKTLESQVADRTRVAENRATALRRLAEELSQTEHRERKRLAKLLHDDLQQQLVGVRMLLGGLKDVPFENWNSYLAKADEMLKESQALSRNLTKELSPPLLQVGSLGELVRWLVTRFEETNSLDIDVNVKEEFPEVPEPVRVFFYQAIRELLFNIIKHSGKREASIQLDRSENQIRVRVEDGGDGFDPEVVKEQLHLPESLGLFQIQERLDALGGKMIIDRSASGGASFCLLVPEK